MSEWIPDDDWETIVRNVPIVPVDLLVECPEGIMLGKRMNEPAVGEWFVPGGRVQKGERLAEAVPRVAEEELGADVEIQESLGTFEHFYETSEVASEKHYVAQGYHVWTDQTTFERGGQHQEVAAFRKVPTNLHEYVDSYLEASPVET